MVLKWKRIKMRYRIGCTDWNLHFNWAVYVRRPYKALRYIVANRTNLTICSPRFEPIASTYSKFYQSSENFNWNFLPDPNKIWTRFSHVYQVIWQPMIESESKKKKNYWKVFWDWQFFSFSIFKRYELSVFYTGNII